jgi:DNA-binding CsgD family transcriptional regulator
MHLALTPDDQDRLQDAQQTLLSPLDYESVDAWRRSAVMRIQQLLGADKGYFMLPINGRADVHSDEYAPGKVSAYPEKIEPIARRYKYWHRVTKLGVHNRAMAWGGGIDKYYQSPYYNEFVLARRAFNATGMTVGIEGIPKENTVAQLAVLHDAPRTKPFGQRGLMLLRLLYPAFKAGVEAWYRLARRRADLADSLDAAGVAVQMSDLDGRVLHRTPMLTRALAANPQREQVAARIEQVTEALIQQARGAIDPREGRLDAVHDIVRTQGGSYRVCGTLVRQGLVSSREVVLVTLSRKASALVPLHRMEERFDLTPRQAEVAQLLAQRKTNREIAAALCISPHTARHHTEAVLDKLNLHSRTGVRDRIHESIQA